MRKAAPMARKRHSDDDGNYWDAITLLMPYSFAPAATAIAHRYKMPVLEYCRRALLLRLEADGVRLDDFDRAA
jgi:hypothetical protein